MNSDSDQQLAGRVPPILVTGGWGFEVINLGSDKPVVLMDTLRFIENLVGPKADIVLTSPSGRRLRHRGAVRKDRSGGTVPPDPFFNTRPVAD